MRKPADIVQIQLEAYNTKDLDLFLKCYHQEITIHDLSDPKPKLQGHSAFKDHYSKLFQENPELKCEVKNRLLFESFIVDDEWMTGLRKYPSSLRIGVVYQVIDELIKTVWLTR